MSLILSGSDGVSDIDGTVSTPAIRGTDSNTGIFFPAADTIAFSEGGVESMRIDSAGDVGIGNTSPYAKLQTYQSSSTLPVQYMYRGTQGSDLNLPTTYGFPYLQIGRTEFRANSLQTIGFGYINTDGNNPPAEIGYLTTSTSGETIGDLVFATRSVTTNTAATERMRITSAGDVGIGNTGNTSYRLLVKSGSSQSAIATEGVTGDTALQAILITKFDNNSTTSQNFIQFQINNGGANSGKITANGANAATFTSTSDARLKENITNLPLQLDNICALRPVEFDYIESEGGGHQIGFIAQEMQQVYSDVVSEQKNGMLQISGWSKTEARLVKAIQELKAELDSVKAELATLKAQP